RARRSFSSAVIELPGACSPSRSVVSKMMTSLPMSLSRAPIAWSRVKKNPRTLSGPRRLLLSSFAATVSSVRHARAADPLLSSNAQQDEDQKQNQRELHHRPVILQS